MKKPATRLFKDKRRGGPISKAGLSRLRDELREAQETLSAIRSGEVDAVVVNSRKGCQVYSLTGAEQPYRVYVERMQEGAVTVSAEGVILYCNQRFADMLQMPLERVISSQMMKHVGQDVWKTISNVFHAHEDVVKHECSLQRLDGSDLPINLTASRLPLGNQSVMCLVVSDLTGLRKQEELRVAKELADKANHAKDDFLAALSHELRTPLNPILLIASDAAANLDLSPAVRANFDVIRRNVEMEARLIDDLLDLTRVSSGKLNLEKRNVNVLALLKRTISMMQGGIDQKKITLEQKFEAFQNTISGDAVRLQQIFWNILKNSTKFTPPKGIITVETRSVRDEYIVSISDTGIGMTKQEVGRAFTAFTQGEHAEEPRRFGGLGLGLTISKKLVELHSGSIEATSEGRNRGSTFTIKFPLADWNERPVKYDLSTARDQPVTSSGIRILLVEDHEPTRIALAGMLVRRKHKVSLAISVREAVALNDKNDFDVVIADIGLPDGNGYDLFKKLRKRSPAIKGIAMTGYGMEDDRARSKDAGFGAHLTKPIQIQSLENALGTTMTP